MRDDYCIKLAENEAPIPIRNLSTADIHDCLRNGIQPVNGQDDPAEACMERLRIELVIREISP